ncbi:MAG: hypothetical protein JWR61_3610 [Ferruginibacter sp.]|nr:hypothetical protein [Ferruginibacter sp.]
MKNDNLILDKTVQFSLRIVKLFVHLKETKVERDLCLQLIIKKRNFGWGQC